MRIKTSINPETRPRRSGIIILFCVLLCLTPLFSSTSHGGEAECGLAKKISERAAQEFMTDKQEGLKLFLKAIELCPSDPDLNFNLGLAYYRYGSFQEAETYLKRAVEKVDYNGDWLNILAWVMLENSSEKPAALGYAKEASKLMPDSPYVYDTLIRAYLENGNLYEAVMGAKEASARWQGDRKIAWRYDAAIDEYISFYIQKAKEGEYGEAVRWLRRIDFDPDVTNAYCWALFAAGKPEDALMEARMAKERFAGADALKDTFDQIMDRFIVKSYVEFKEGKRSEAIMAVDRMRKIYTGNKRLNDAYEKMMKVVLEEADTFDIPEQRQGPSIAADMDDRKSTRLLNELQGSRSSDKTEEKLSVDVDTDIPKGKYTRPYGIAIIIGNKNYSHFGHSIPDVDYAIRDASYMKKYVINVLGYQEENIIYEIDVTQGKMWKIFGTREDYKGQLYNWIVSDKSEVFIYYVGHGAPDPRGTGAFLMPVDADADYIAANGYPLDIFYDNLSNLPAKVITVVLDACFSGDSAGGMLVKNVSPAMLKTTDPARSLSNAIIFSSAGKDQVSHWYPQKGHSLFTYFFMKGLQGKADANKDKIITLQELKDYLSEEVPYRARRLTGREQTPIVLGDETWEMVRFK